MEYESMSENLRRDYERNCSSSAWYIFPKVFLQILEYDYRHALILASLVNEARKRDAEDTSGGWFHVPVKALMAEFDLSRAAMSLSLNRLRKWDLLSIERRGNPSRNYYRIRYEEIDRLVQDLPRKADVVKTRPRNDRPDDVSDRGHDPCLGSTTMPVVDPRHLYRRQELEEEEGIQIPRSGSAASGEVHAVKENTPAPKLHKNTLPGLAKLETAQEKCDADPNYRRAYRLWTALESRGRAPLNGRKTAMARWTKSFREMTAVAPAEPDFDLVLEWYCSSYDHRFVPKVRSADAYASRYGDVVAAYRRAARRFFPDPNPDDLERATRSFLQHPRYADAVRLLPRVLGWMAGVRAALEHLLPSSDRDDAEVMAFLLGDGHWFRHPAGFAVDWVFDHLLHPEDHGEVPSLRDRGLVLRCREFSRRLCGNDDTFRRVLEKTLETVQDCI